MMYVFIVVTFVMIIVVEIFTVLFRMTGISEERSRFQVISLITGAGYTTAESESIVKQGMRRKLAQIIILLGYTASLTLVAIFVNFYSGEDLNNREIYSFLIYAALLVFIYNAKFVRRGFDSLVEKAADYYLRKNHHNKIHTLGHFRDSIIAELTILEDIGFLGKQLKDTDLKKEKIQVLNIKRDNLDIVNPVGENCLKKNDIVLLFGSEENIRRVFRTL